MDRKVLKATPRIDIEPRLAARYSKDALKRLFLRHAEKTSQSSIWNNSEIVTACIVTAFRFGNDVQSDVMFFEFFREGNKNRENQRHIVICFRETAMQVDILNTILKHQNPEAEQCGQFVLIPQATTSKPNKRQFFPIMRKQNKRDD